MSVIERLSAVVPVVDGAGGCCLASAEARALLKALADPIRLQVVEALAGGERCVCELADALALAQPRLSFHLKVLKDAGLLEGRQQGRWTYYRLRTEAISALRLWLDQLLVCCSSV
ncbi:MAG: ArsR family transcriptional regulator [Synechococcaceae bacterium WB9_2_112]|nr:ArsR family transcriptional regulator [Synechococcaceae bacterium WB9_2_112]